VELDEEKFSQKNISNLIRNILTLRYDPSQKPSLPALNPDNFLPSKKYDPNIVEDNLKSSIETKLASAKNLTISLSGGIDSTLVLALIRKTLPNLKINAISIKFADSVDETASAKKIADFFETEHKIINVENYLLELPNAISIVEMPFWDIHWYYIAKNAKEKSNFLASGDGGDELFGGYVFRYSKFLSLIQSNSTPLDKIQAYLSCHERDWVPDQDKIFNSKSNFSWKSINSIFQPFFDNSLSPLNQVFLADYNGKLLHNFSTISNKINQFFNLKPIVPILEPKIISYASHLPTELKYNSLQNIGKLPLRKLLKKYECDSLVSKEKLGFSVNTINLWNSIGKELCISYLDNARIVEDGWINKEWISSHILKPDLDVRYVNKFLGLLSLEIWYRLFVTKEMNSTTKLS
jgi:asparagine synthase (glutamine-hydrolysing)